MWLAHYSFHLLTSYDTVVPATQRFAADLGWPAFGPPHWVAGCCRRVADWLPRWRSSFSTWDCCFRCTPATALPWPSRPHVSRMPCATLGALWALLIALLFAAGIWLVFQPMQMRGTP